VIGRGLWVGLGLMLAAASPVSLSGRARVVDGDTFTRDDLSRAERANIATDLRWARRGRFPLPDGLDLRLSERKWAACPSVGRPFGGGRTVWLGVTRILPIGVASFHSLIHRSEQGLGGDRLGEVNVGARGPAGLDMFSHRIRCHHDDRNVPTG
jgi:hypothetical protein